MVKKYEGKAADGWLAGLTYVNTLSRHDNIMSWLELSLASGKG